MPMNEMTDYQKCLKSICEYDATIPGPCSYCGGVYPCTWIAKDTGISVYKVRKIMKQLETDGYVDKDSFGGYDDWNDRIYCIHGYKVTEKAIALDYWKSKHKQDEDDMRKLCELPMPEVTTDSFSASSMSGGSA